MVGFASKDGACPQLLDLIHKEREWFVEEKEDEDEEKKLELRLGPPVEEEDWRIKHDGFFFKNINNNNNNNNNNNTFSGAKRVFLDIKEPGTERVNGNNGGGNLNQSFQSPCPCPWKQQQQTNPPFLQLQSIPKGIPVMENESSQHCSTKATQKNAFSPSPSNNNNNTAVHCPSRSDQKRIGSAPAVGWPPIRSFRKNLINNGGGTGSSSSKVASCEEKAKNGLFVKINMEGVAIGRKVDLKAYDSYEKLSTVVDELFRGLFAAQRDSSSRSKAITGLLDGSGEFTLVYEDIEGDTVLVGDVPWHMFVCTVRRLRVIKSSEIPKLCGSLGSSKKGKPPPNAAFE